MENRERNCGYCGGGGHQVRTCTTPELLVLRRTFMEMIRNAETIDTIVNWLHQIKNVKLLKIVVMHYIRIGFHTVITKEELIDRTVKRIDEEYLQVLQLLVNELNEQIVRIDHLDMVLTPTIIRDSYNEINDHMQISDEEHTLLCGLILDIPQVTMNISYDVILRVLRYTSVVLHEYDLVHNVQPVKYTYDESTKAPPSITDSCPICFDDMKWRDAFTTECGHHFCQKCIHSTIKQDPGKRCACPMCRAPLEKMYYYDMQKT